MSKLAGQLNFDQKEAIQMALKQPFTVIQGPPGSGKTLTAAHLACLFVERNRMTPQSAHPDMTRTQVLICASSDTAVDVIAGRIRKEKGPILIHACRYSCTVFVPKNHENH